jgi:TPP-dependent pyruvate/acetoin dehydrogenase alpha subunit
MAKNKQIRLGRNIPKEANLLQMLEDMHLLRAFDDKVGERCRRAEIPGLIHLGNGEEAVAVGVCAALDADDKMTSTHRGHSHFLAKGGDPNAFMAELYGKRTGCCGGKGGSMHLYDQNIGFLGCNGVVGGGLPIATGAALGSDILGNNSVTVCFFGDGANNQGTFHESLNLAAVWALPIIFVCENNGYGISQSIHDQQMVDNVADRAPSYGMRGEIIDGNDILAVYEAVAIAVASARAGNGPTLIECKTYRIGGHYVGDSESYRSPEEIKEWQQKDPIERFEKLLLKQEILSEAARKKITKRVTKIVDGALSFAKRSPFPEPEATYSNVYADT